MLERISPAPVIGAGDILVVACLRNEALRLPWFLSYHRRLGVTRFLMVDNGSDDGSRQMLEGQPDVTLFHTDQSYADSRCGIDWQNALLAEYGLGHWVLVVDVDEFLIYPGQETTSLPDLITYLERQSATALLAPMLDMYADRPFAETGYVAGTDMLACCPYFDASGYQLGPATSPTHGLPVRGGPRHRLFWQGRGLEYPSPVLQKYPLIRWSADLTLEASTHILTGVQVAPVTGLLMHFKFLQDFAPKVRDEATRGEHFAEARQYRAYDAVMAEAPATHAMADVSERYESTVRMVALGLMKRPEDYPFGAPPA